MKFIIEKKDFLTALSRIVHVVESKNTVPALGNIKIKTGNGEICLTATDANIFISARATADVQEAGVITIPALAIYKIVRQLPWHSFVEFGIDKSGEAYLISGQSRFSLSTLPVEDFPVMAEGELPHSFTLTSAELSALIDKTRFAVSTEETRYYLNGIYLHVADGKDGRMLRAVATDGHRLAALEITLPAGAESMPGVIIQTKTILQIRRFCKYFEKVKITLSAKKIRFNFGKNLCVLANPIDYSYQKYEKVIPLKNDKIFIIDKNSFKTAIKRVLCLNSSNNNRIKLVFSESKLILSTEDCEYSAAHEMIVDGTEDIKIGFNYRYILDVLERINGQKVLLAFSDNISSVLVMDNNDSSALYVIMPQRI